MREAKLFKNGQSQAVRLPKEFRFKGDAVYIKRQGHGVLLLPKDQDLWDVMLASLGEFAPGLALERDQGTQQVRPPLLPGARRRRQGRRR